ncbi:MAG: ABC transporter permease [Clostridiales bacterium]|jgi:ABC-type transport system involved in multi-copper enzyme maturation permease subunit|nr:ABC transporter permease [Clostridiales bacterium]
MKAIALATLKEAVRKKTFAVMTLVSALYLALWALLLNFFKGSIPADDMSMGFASVILAQMGLQFSSMILCLLTIMLSSGSIASELETGMVHSIISRPLRRFEYVLGKFLGLLSLTLAYAAAVYAILMLIGSLFFLNSITSISATQFFKGLALYVLVPAVILCPTIYGSVSLRAVPNGLLMIFLYILGNIGGMVEMIGRLIGSDPVESSGIFLSLVSPFHTIFSSAERTLLPSSGIVGEMMSGANGLSGSGKPASAWMFLYIAVYAVGFLTLAIRKFSRKDIN